jgi:ABC-type lipoprotein export system ATPase subunit
MSSIKLLTNPFEGQRWEHDAEHIIYLPEIFAELEKRQDLYIVGSRGTGKTTFLKALNWNTRVENRSIHAQIEKGDLFKNSNYSALLKFRPTHLVSPVPKLKYPLIHYPKMEQMAFR